jgi:hypothetical protein
MPTTTMALQVQAGVAVGQAAPSPCDMATIVAAARQLASQGERLPVADGKVERMKRRDRYNAISYLLADETGAARSEQVEYAIGTALAVATMSLPAHTRRRDYLAMFAATNRMLKARGVSRTPGNRYVAPNRLPLRNMGLQAPPLISQPSGCPLC